VFDSVSAFFKEETTMKSHIRYAILLLIAALTPFPASAALIFSDMFFVAETRAATQLLPTVSDSDTENVPNEGAGAVNALSRALGANAAPFPNLPNSVGSAFASATLLTLGGGSILSGVGVNGFFLRNSLPPNQLTAFALIDQTITNNSTTDTESLLANFFIPAPTMQFFGVGNSFPAGADPARDASAFVEALLVANLTRADGSSGGQEVILNYGMRTSRGPTGVFSAFPLSSDSVGLTRFDEPDGSFGFRLPALTVQDLALTDIGPGESLDVIYQFQASASTGFGETGIFAAIGDPFDLNASGVRFDLQPGDVVEPDPEPGPGIPAPGTLPVLGLGLCLLGRSMRRRVPITRHANRWA
jgi:hypothetical protein